jgi:hypothetical protein
MAAGRYATNGSMLSLLTEPERGRVKSYAEDFWVFKDGYAEAEALDVLAALPKELWATPVVHARYEGVKEGRKAVRLGINGPSAFVSARAFSTLYKRHPRARWHFAAGDYWALPVVLLDAGGRVVGALPTALGKAGAHPLLPTAGPFLAKAVRLGDVRYAPGKKCVVTP